MSLKSRAKRRAKRKERKMAVKAVHEANERIRLAVMSITGHEKISLWRRTEEYQRLQELAIQRNGPECSCCDRQSTKVLLTKYDAATITGFDMKHWRPLCENHYHYIMVKAVRVTKSDMFYAMRQLKQSSLSVV